MTWDNILLHGDIPDPKQWLRDIVSDSIEVNEHETKSEIEGSLDDLDESREIGNIRNNRKKRKRICAIRRHYKRAIDFCLRRALQQNVVLPPINNGLCQ